MNKDQTKILSLLSDGSPHALEDIEEALITEKDCESVRKYFPALERINYEIKGLEDAGLVKEEFVEAEGGYMLTKVGSR
jgi:hypothetical protein